MNPVPAQAGLGPSDLLDPVLAASLGRREVPGPPSPHPHRGIHRSPRRGASLEFSEHTLYARGDDPRHLDWKVLARSDRYLVKRYEDERLQRVLLLVDASASMAYGAGEGGLRSSKYHLAARLAATLAACLLRQGDAVGVALARERGGEWLPPRSGPAQLGAVLEVLGGARPDGAARLGEACRGAGERLRRDAAVFVFSDFLDEGDERLEGVRLLRARGLAPRVVHLLHADEVGLPFENTSRFLDLEGPASRVLDPLPLRRAYREEIAAFVGRVAAQADGLGVPHAFLTGVDDPAPALVRLLRRAGRR
ncbi:MAG: DUF58 domain-containing protein [Deferrisomatales bacterium]|nr:DUF58 domain-containing protein [Deferrisomatales bacterium]